MGRLILRVTKTPAKVGTATVAATGKLYMKPKVKRCGLKKAIQIHISTPKNGSKKHTGSDPQTNARRIKSRIVGPHKRTFVSMAAPRCGQMLPDRFKFI